jgi:GDP-L-fucose synthase
MKKLLVTGASGLIGSAIQNVSKNSDRIANYEVIPLTRADCDLTNFQDTKAIFQYIKPDYVIHTAAIVGGIGSNMNHPGKFFCDNIAINTNVLESARLVKVEKLISYMSTCVFPDVAQYPLNEKDIHNGPPHPSNAAYAHAKRMLDVQSKAYRSEYGCNFITLIPTNIYGPHDNFDLVNGHVLPSLIQRCYLAQYLKQIMLVWGTGNPLREFIFSDDIALLSLEALECYNESEPLIVSSGIEISIKDALAIVVAALDFENEIIFDNSKPDGQFRKPSDTSKLEQYFPNFKFTSVSDGLSITIKWFLTHFPNVRGAELQGLVDPWLQTR